MANVDTKRLLEKCNTFCTQALYNAAALAVDRTHYEVATEHFLLKCLESTDADMALLLKHYGIDRAEAIQNLSRSLDAFTSGNSARPAFSPVLIDLLEAAWLITSVNFQEAYTRSGAVALAYAKRPAYYAQSGHTALAAQINREEATKNFALFTADSQENIPTSSNTTSDNNPAVASAPSAQGQGFIGQFCEDFTAKARAGNIDTVFGRDAEIRSVLTILARRRKNNPILVGEPGVGKTAVIEGLAKRIVEGDCPEALLNVSLLSLDMGLLEAGASMKGEFERRLKGVIDEVKSSPTPIILFIDEAHMLVGAGGTAGGSDAANLLKPALARGELRTCAATTWKEYKKYFEKDPALARRFQPVSLEEPDTATATLILRGLCQSYEQSHHVVIHDDALCAAVDLAHRFISGRFLPDKAIDLLDTACAKVKMSLSVKPAPLEDAERLIQTLQRECAALERDATHKATEKDNHTDLQERIEALQQSIAETQEHVAMLTEAWCQEKAAADAFIRARENYAAALTAHTTSENTLEKTLEKEEDEQPLPSLEECQNTLNTTLAALTAQQGDSPLLHVAVTPDVVAQVISDWTGIPVGKVAREEASLVADLDSYLTARVTGQDAAIAMISKVIKASKAGLRAAGAPLGVFLLVGPSGVGKTETGLALADTLFGNEENAVTINMSEFQERHTVSRLIGSPPGYVGYGEGGLLTEAVRRNPYSVVLLDEVEKAHPDVMNLFYQVFDKGILTDGEGQKISFASTVLLLTSNLATDTIQNLTEQGIIDKDIVQEHIHQELAAHFKPALLARMTVVPYCSLNDTALATIARMKLTALATRIHNNNGITLHYTNQLVDSLVARCTTIDTGARSIDHILAAHVLPQLAQRLLEEMAKETESIASVCLDVHDDGSFSIDFAKIQE